MIGQLVNLLHKATTCYIYEYYSHVCAHILYYIMRSNIYTVHIRIEEFWRETGKILPKSYSDQGRINYGLKALRVEWHSLSDGSFEGVCANGLKVSTLSYSRVCRSNCMRNKMGAYYVWHKPAPRDGQSKMKAASQGNMWLLSTKWNLDCVHLELKQQKWLECIRNRIA